jgi:uncharacterized membrane protein
MDRFLVVLHVPAGLISVVVVVVAMLARKGGRVHRRAGLVYLLALGLVCLSGVGLVVTRWPRFPHLLGLGLLAAALAGFGYVARRRPSPALHLLGMSGSYVAMLTAFYVDNGPKLPVWRLLPPVVFWFLPSVVALPLVLWALHRHGGRRAIARRGSESGSDTYTSGTRRAES